MTISELTSDIRFSDQFHFHKVHKSKYENVKAVLEAYSFNAKQIEQFLDGENIYQFTGNLEGQDIESRIICECIKGTIHVLFFDTNHHIYFNKSKSGESLNFSYCPYNSPSICTFNFACFAKSFLDVNKISETYGYDYSPD